MAVSDPGLSRQLGRASWGVSVAGIIISIIIIVITVAVAFGTANEATSALNDAAAKARATTTTTKPKSSCSSTFYVNGFCYSLRTDNDDYYCYGYSYRGYCYY